MGFISCILFHPVGFHIAHATSAYVMPFKLNCRNIWRPPQCIRPLKQRLCKVSQPMYGHAVLINIFKKTISFNVNCRRNCRYSIMGQGKMVFINIIC